MVQFSSKLLFTPDISAIIDMLQKCSDGAGNKFEHSTSVVHHTQPHIIYLLVFVFACSTAQV